MGKHGKHSKHSKKNERRSERRSASEESNHRAEVRDLFNRIKLLETEINRRRSPPSRSCSRLTGRKHSRSSPSTSRSRSPVHQPRAVAVNSRQDRACSPSSSLDRSLAEVGACSTANTPPTDTLIIQDEDTLSDDIIKILGEDPDPKQDISLLHDALASRWRHVLIHGLKKDEATSLSDKYEIPGNLSELTPPKLNPEILSILDKQSHVRDGSYTEIQTQLGKSLCALGKGINLLLSNGDSIPSEIKNDMLEFLCDSGRFLTNLFHRQSITRRNLINPLLNKSVKAQVENSPPSELLFGSDLGEKVKIAKGLESVSKDLKVVKPAVYTKPTAATAKKGGASTQHAPAANKDLNYQRPARREDATRSYRGQTSKGSKRTNQDSRNSRRTQRKN